MRPPLPLVAAILLSVAAAALPACSDSGRSLYDDEEQCAAAEPNDSPEQAVAIAVGAAPLAAAICRPDIDFYAFTAPAGPVIVRIDLRFEQDGTQGDLDLRLYNRANTLLASSLSSDDDEAIICPGAGCSTLPAGDYVIEVREPLASLTGNGYQLSVKAQ